MKKSHKLKVYKAITAKMKHISKVPKEVRMVLKAAAKSAFQRTLERTDDFIEAIDHINQEYAESKNGIEALTKKIKPRIRKFIKDQMWKKGKEVSDEDIEDEVNKIIMLVQLKAVQIMKENPDLDLENASFHIMDGMEKMDEESSERMTIRIPKIDENESNL